MNNLIERLRDFDLTRQFTGGQHPLITEAANEIERLTEAFDLADGFRKAHLAEIERLTEYNDTLEMLNLSGKELVKRLQARVEALEAKSRRSRFRKTQIGDR